MILPDINLLIYAYNAHDPRHKQARAWFEGIMNGDELVALPWVTLSGFIRIITHPRALQIPMSPGQATAVVRTWLAEPGVRVPHPTADYAQVFLGLLDQIGTAGNLTSDAQLAALAIENNATLYSNDTDFGRFPGLRWKNPLR